MQYLLNYFLIAVIVGLILKYAPGIDMDDNQIMSTILVALGIVLLTDILFMRSSEGFRSPIDLMDQMSYVVDYDDYEDGEGARAMDQDELKSRLRFGFLDSDPALLHHGDFTYDLRGRSDMGPRISMDEIQSLMCQSKMDDFAEIMNPRYPIPNMQSGKNRGPLDLQKLN